MFTIIHYANFGDYLFSHIGIAAVEFHFSPLTCVVFLTTYWHYCPACDGNEFT